MNRCNPTPAVARVALALSLAVAGGAASAQKMAPGLWEHTTRMGTADGRLAAAQAQMETEMAKLSPEQRKMMADMMAAQGAGMGPQGSTVRTCLTPEQAERDSLPQADEDCKLQTTRRSGSKLNFTFNCEGDTPGRGEGEFTMSGPKAYSGRSIIDTVVDGKPQRLTVQQSGRWLATDCGAVKPQR